ncbi:MAG: ATP-dependent DNA helicase RecG, partial [Solobacterium sp.]|nr:ATP-dependent DNA helicase RecG [Solobacterium sp.]
NDFEDNRIQILVSTTVVEVGVNVINATGMIIYDAERFGMSQIHQLRGRVQRGSEQGRCWLLTGTTDAEALERLQILAETSDGFRISYEDLRLRGPGDILGTRQSGLPGITLGNLVEDTGMINAARQDAEMIVRDPGNPDYRRLLESIAEENRKNAAYID